MVRKKISFLWTSTESCDGRVGNDLRKDSQPHHITYEGPGAQRSEVASPSSKTSLVNGRARSGM